MIVKILLLYMIIINVIGFYLMYADKQKAKRGQYRIRESTLWNIAWVGGAIGTTFGMNTFRHKTKHTAFKFGFPVLAIIDACLYLYGFIIIS